MHKVRSWIRRCALAWLGFAGAAFANPLPSPDSPEFRSKVEALAKANATVVGVRSTAVEDAWSNENLGRVRHGSGVAIGDGLVVTIGYLILEADQVELVAGEDRVVPARVVAYDLASGFGLLQALTPLRVPAATLGNSSSHDPEDPLMIASGGAEGDMSLAKLVSRRAFSGYWEYHIDGALFTTPPRIDHSGAGLFNSSGELIGIGSLVVMDTQGPDQPRLPGNMFVPVDLLKEILPELRARGLTRNSIRPWLGVNCVEVDGAVRVVRVSPESPAESAGLSPGDMIVSIDGTAVSDLTGLYKVLWRGPGAEREVTLDITRNGKAETVKLRSKDRMKTLRQAKGV